jgi:hypothetical protein
MLIKTIKRKHVILYNSLLSNIPPGIYDERRKSSILTFPNQESVNIIDLYSWGYVILILIYYSKSERIIGIPLYISAACRSCSFW